MSAAEKIKYIMDLTDYTSFIAFDKHPKQGQFVCTGPHCNGIHRRLGYCVQVRKKRGVCGSDQVFLRHQDGELCVHENQGYYVLTDTQIELARAIFKDLPENEDYSHGYTIAGEQLEKGFLIF